MQVFDESRVLLDGAKRRSAILAQLIHRDLQATGTGHWGLLPIHATDFGPDPEFLGPGSSMLYVSDVIAAEVEEVIDLIVG